MGRDKGESARKGRVINCHADFSLQASGGSKWQFTTSNYINIENYLWRKIKILALKRLYYVRLKSTVYWWFDSRNQTCATCFYVDKLEKNLIH